jgi:uncharacterized membrane protein YkoI
MTRISSRRRALTIAGLAAAATLAVGGAALAAGNDSPRDALEAATVAATDSPSPEDSPTPDDSPSADDSTTTPANPDATVSSELAVGIALNRTGGGAVTNVEAEFEHGRAAWKVRVVKDGVRYDVYVDAATGEIIRFRQQSEDGRNNGDDNGRDDHGGDDHGRHGGDDDRGGHGGSGRDHPEDD